MARAMYKYSDSLLAINGSQSVLLSVWLWLLLSAVNCSSDLWNSIQAPSLLPHPQRLQCNKACWIALAIRRGNIKASSYD